LLRWLSALAAAVFDALPVLPERNTFEAALAAFAPVRRPAMRGPFLDEPLLTGGAIPTHRSGDGGQILKV
jgi:hypothetical protein